MSINRYKTAAGILYVLAVGCLLLYGWLNFHARLLRPETRVALLFAACALAYSGSRLMAKMSGDNAEKIMRGTFRLFFLLYLALLALFTLFDPFFGRTGYAGVAGWNVEAFQEYLETSVNLIPFVTISRYVSAISSHAVGTRTIVTNLLGNLAAFSPFALFLPLLCKKLSNFGLFLLSVLLIAVCIELLQLVLLTGSCDVDDVLLNVSGACLLFGVLHIGPVRRAVSRFTLLRF